MIYGLTLQSESKAITKSIQPFVAPYCAVSGIMVCVHFAMLAMCELYVILRSSVTPHIFFWGGGRCSWLVLLSTHSLPVFLGSPTVVVNPRPGMDLTRLL